VYPESAREANIQGRVTVMFVIDKEGNVINVRARGSVGGSELEEEAIRIVNLLPQFKPGIHRGKPVNVSFSFYKIQIRRTS
jgi:protein TonB